MTTILPGLGRVPRDASPELKRFLEALQETIEIRNGLRGDPKDRAVTLRELIDSGLAKDLESTPFDPNNPTESNIGFQPTNPIPDSTTPTAPTSFVVTSGYANISLSWAYPFTYGGHSFTEIWRHTSNDLTAATFIGTSAGNTFVDPVGSVTGTTFYYWIRHVSISGELGPFNASSGTTGSTATDVNLLLTSLSSSITSSQLASSLATPIGNLPANTNASFTAVTNTTNALGAQYTVKVQTATQGNGVHVAGYGLATQATNGTTTSAFIVAASKFAVVNPANHSLGQNNNDPTESSTSGAGVVPFTVVTEQAFPIGTDGATVPAGVYINNAFLNKATISTLLAGSIVGDFIKAQVVMDAPHIHVGTINIGTINKPDANNPRTWSHSGVNRLSKFSVDANGVMHCRGATITRESDNAVVFDASELNGVYIKDASVDTLSIAGNAVTVPAGDSASSLTINVGNSYTDASNFTTLPQWDNDKRPSALIIGGQVGYTGADTSGSSSQGATGYVKFVIEWDTGSSGSPSYSADVVNSNNTVATQSFRSGNGGQVVTTNHIAVPEHFPSGTTNDVIGCRVKIQGKNQPFGSGGSNFRRLSRYGFFVLGSKR